jgi:NhaP-type Na+/H+ or K+/H+ antiporter
LRAWQNCLVPSLLTLLALAAFVLVFAGLTEGLVSRAPLSFPMIFLGLGFLLGSRGVISTDSSSPTLEAVATVALALVLFLDAVRMKFDRAPSEWLVPSLVLGPGTILCVVLVAAASHYILGTGVALSLLLGAILSSTDPVIMRDIVGDKRVPGAIRETLKIEAATNDVVVLPVVLVMIAVSKTQAATPGEWAVLLGKLLVIGPVIGFAVGGLGAWLMSLADKRFGIRREYQSLFGMGLVFASYTSAVAAGGDGFLASFAAGAAIAALDLELCDCFLEYGDATSEMIMLFVFILFGAVLSTLVTTVPLAPVLLLAGFALLVARPVAISIVLRRAEISPSARAFIAWFGPRGLASLLLALLAVQAGIAGSERVLAIAGIVVTVSVILHGITATPVTGWYAKKVSVSTLSEERATTASGLWRLSAPESKEASRIEAAELVKLMAGSSPPIVLDLRSRSSYEKDPEGIPGEIRLAPDQVANWAAKRTRDQLIVAYCT